MFFEGFLAGAAEHHIGDQRRFKMKRLPSLTMANVLATAGVLLAGYVFLANLNDVRRYIRISTM
jgi:hypothetical protein